MFTATANLILPSTTTGSFPRPRWYDVSMWGRPLDTCMQDVRFREKFQDALAVVISAILDALAPLGVRDMTMPATPFKVWTAIQNARRQSP